MNDRLGHLSPEVASMVCQFEEILGDFAVDGVAYGGMRRSEVRDDPEPSDDAA